MQYLRLFLSLALLSFAVSSLEAAGERLPAQQIMTPEELDAIGYNNFTAEQKAAFESWAAAWTHHVIEQAPSYRPGQNISLWVQTWPSYANPTKTELTPEEMKARQISNQIIDKI